MFGDNLDFPGVAYVARTISFDTSSIGTAATVPVGKLPGGAIVYDAFLAITTAFNAGSSNTLLVGTSDDTDRFLYATQPGTLLARGHAAISSAGRGYIVPAGGELAYVQYTQTGTAATTGAARAIVLYIPRQIT